MGQKTLWTSIEMAFSKYSLALHSKKIEHKELDFSCGKAITGKGLVVFTLRSWQTI